MQEKYLLKKVTAKKGEHLLYDVNVRFCFSNSEVILKWWKMKGTFPSVVFERFPIITILVF